MKRNGKPRNRRARRAEAPPPKPPALDYSKPLPLYLDGAELAALLNTSKRTVGRWRMEGSGPRFARAGGKVLYSRDVVLAWVAAAEVNSTSAP